MFGERNFGKSFFNNGNVFFYYRRQTIAYHDKQYETKEYH